MEISPWLVLPLMTGLSGSFDPYTSDLRFVGVSSPSIRKYIFTENTARTRQHMEILEYDLIERI